MPSNFTENFNLSQWERSDKVLMDDFNADNAKIDAALFCHPSAERICSVEVEEETEQLEMDISLVDWSRYMALALVMDSPESTGFTVTMGSGNEHTVLIYRNSSPAGSASGLCYFPTASHMTMIVPVFYDGSHAVSVVSFGSGEAEGGFGFLGGGGGSASLSLCKRLRIRRREASFQPKDRAMLWGIK